MCVIIYIPVGVQISRDELLEAWRTNSDGAGFALITNNGTVKYQRGFMTFNSFYNAVHQYIGGYDLVLHFRISTSDKVNKLQTHPYEVGNKTALKGETSGAVVCMNGVLSDQPVYKGFNDTMSYIQDHAEAFSIIGAEQSQDLLDIMAEHTAVKWAIITPQGVLYSYQFQEYKGRYYSNKNHLIPPYTYYRSYCKNYRKKPTIKSLCKSKYIYDQIVQDRPLYYLLVDLIDIWADYPYILDHIFDTYNIEELEARAYQYY